MKNGEKFGYRNAQVTVLAPTGTIGFMMDCDTTGIEPDLALVKYKKLVGGGMIKIVNNTVPAALFKLGYTSDQINAIVSLHRRHRHHRRRPCHQRRAPGGVRLLVQAVERHAHHSLPGPPAHDGGGPAVHLRRNFQDHQHARERHGRRDHRSLRAGLEAGPEGSRHLSRWLEEGAAAQLDGLGHIEGRRVGSAGGHGWNFGCPTLVRRTGWAKGGVEVVDEAAAPPRAIRHRLPDERLSITHKFSVGGHEGYLTVGLYKDGMPGELFITMAKEGSTVSGLMDSFACAVSLALQHGVPLKLMCEKFAHTRFEPSGWSHNQDIGYAKSIMDYIFRWLQLRFLTGQQQALFDGLRPKYVNAPPPGVPDENGYGQKHSAMCCRRTARPVLVVITHFRFVITHFRFVITRRSRGTCFCWRWHDPPSRLRRPERPDRPGRRPHLSRLRRHHDAERQLLPLQRVRQHQRM